MYLKLHIADVKKNIAAAKKITQEETHTRTASPLPVDSLPARRPRVAVVVFDRVAGLAGSCAIEVLMGSFCVPLKFDVDMQFMLRLAEFAEVPKSGRYLKVFAETWFSYTASFHCPVDSERSSLGSRRS